MRAWLPERQVYGPEPAGERDTRSEEHTSELQSQSNLVCRLLLEKKKTKARTRSQKNTSSIQSQTNLLCSSLIKHKTWEKSRGRARIPIEDALNSWRVSPTTHTCP